MVVKTVNRRLKDIFASRLMLAATLFVILVLFLMVFSLLQKSWPILTTKSLGELLSWSWHPLRGEFGFSPFIMGTLAVTAVAMVIAIPLSIFTAIYIAEYAPGKIRGVVKPFIDLLAGIPSVVFGLFGVLVLVPLVGNYLAPLVGTTSTGYSVLAGGIVLAMMVFPIMISISIEVFRAVPDNIREASLALGATRWEMVKHVVVRSSLPGVGAAILLAFGRAFGETLAVMMVVGNSPVAPSLFGPAYPLTALIANNYGEMMSVPMYESALMLAALVLLVAVVISNVIARIILRRVKRRYVVG